MSVQWFGSEALELTYKTPAGKVANEILYRDDESRLELAELGRPWSFDGDGALFRPVSEAMLPRQPLRFLLAHDPGAGKSIGESPATSSRPSTPPPPSQCSNRRRSSPWPEDSCDSTRSASVWMSRPEMAAMALSSAASSFVASIASRSAGAALSRIA